MMTIGVSLFAGIGGFDIALEKADIPVAVQCEYDLDCQHELRHHFPDAYLHGDIHTLTGEIINEEIEKRFGPRFDPNGIARYGIILAGGFPCQPYSGAGKRKGTEDDRYLWPETVRIARELRPDAVIFENVAGLTTILEPGCYADMEEQAARAIRGHNIGLFDEPAKREKVEIPFEIIQQRILGRIYQDLEEAGLEPPRLASGEPVCLLVPACAIGANHRRDRVWIVANARLHEREGRDETAQGLEHAGGREPRNEPSPLGGAWPLVNPAGAGLERRIGEGIQGSGNGPADANEDGIDPDPEGSRVEGDGSEGEQIERPSLEAGLPGRLDGGDPRGDWSYIQTEFAICPGDDGIPARLGGVRLPSTGKPLTANGLNMMALKQAGNAIQPQVAYEIIMAMKAAGII